MSKFSLVIAGLSAALAFTAPTIWSGEARADILGTVYNITYDGCSSGCSSLTSYGTVSVSGNGTSTITVDIDLAPNYYFVSTGNGTTVQFATNSTVNSTTVVNTPVGETTFVGDWGSVVKPTNSLDALGTFQAGLQCTSSGSGAKTCGTDLEFTVNLASSGSLVTETGGQHGALFFGLDLCNSTDGGTTCAGTGPFGATLSPVPGPIFGAGLPGLIAACAGLVAFRASAPTAARLILLQLGGLESVLA